MNNQEQNQGKQIRDNSIEHESKFAIPKEVFEILSLNSLEEIQLNSNNKIIFLRDESKTRPYIYFDSIDQKLLDWGNQLSLRKRDNDYSITFKMGIQNPKDSTVLNRVESNLNISIEDGERIVKDKNLSSLESTPLIRDVLRINGLSRGSDLIPICGFVVETQRNHGILSSTEEELLEIAFDKIIINGSDTIYEMELEMKSLSKVKNINIELTEKLSTLALNKLGQMLQRHKINFAFSENKLDKAKFKRVLHHLGKL
ncbi:MAG: hypothetical protein KDK36_07055 [Leptospiraceae bacterium]|nr:hypothetical protein [Leptospiraceae bacterium]